ncbi:MAG TPA: hypothetical protein VF257_08450 [Solirubrobacteraceae bacterium]
MAGAPDDAVDRLYGLPRDAFVAERDALARELRGAGRRDEAAAVKALPKPTVAGWAVNQAVRSQPRAARELWQAGDALAAAQEAILGGKGSGADLRAATDRERAAVEPLVDAARGLLSSTGEDLSEATIERVRETLHAAAIDPEAREEVAAGRATRERAPRGLFGADAAAPPKAHGREGRAGEGEAATRTREEAAARKRERQEAAARERARKAAADRVAKAERALAGAEKESATAAERLEEARAKERTAVEVLADARADLRALER